MKLPCGWLFRMPRFCDGRRCETCVLKKEAEKIKLGADDYDGAISKGREILRGGVDVDSAGLYLSDVYEEV